MPDRRNTAGAAEEEQIRVPVAEERVEVEKRPVDLGEVRIHKRVDETEERIPVSLEREEVEVQHVPVNRVLEAPVGTRTEGEWLIIPVLEEEVVVQKRLILREEVRIRTRRIAEESEVRETVRRERVEVEEARTPERRRDV